MKAGLLKPFKTVFWSFFGVRKRTDNQDDFAGVSPVQVVIAGVDRRRDICGSTGDARQVYRRLNRPTGYELRQRVFREKQTMLSQSSRYYLPEPSHWPVVGSCSLFLMALGAVLWMNGVGPGPWMVLARRWHTRSTC